jgi:pimeloyl-ACP methyl ester carboxylesterase
VIGPTGAVPLVAVPGLGLGPESWRPTLDRIGTHTAVRLLPGYGVPTGPGRAPSPAELGADLLGRVAEPCVLLGHSSSCQVVAHAARLAPEVVRSLVLVGPTTDPRARSWPALAARWVRTATHERPGQVPALVRQYRRTTLRSMAATMDSARRDDLITTLADVRCPVVAVRGRRDRIVPADWLHRVAGAAPDGTAVELPAGAHMVPLTHPDLLASSLQAAVRAGG